MKKSTQLLEHISALMDGELADGDRELALAALTEDEGRAAWHAYHLIGDQLRAAAEVEQGAHAALAARLRIRLAAEAAAEAEVAAHGPAGAGAGTPSGGAVDVPAAGTPPGEGDGAAPATAIP